MATAAKYLTMPDGRQFEFFGKTWYGECFTAAGTAAKAVDISGFTSDNLVFGARVVVRFTYAHTNGNPTLNLNSTGPKPICSSYSSSSVSAVPYEWDAGAVIGFIYYNSYWVIEDGGHATTLYWGKTKLSNTIGNNQTTALTPYAVYNAGYATTAQLPTKTSDLTNDSGFITLADLPIYNGGVS